MDSSQSDDLVIERLLRVESTLEPTEIVIHVNMLKEGWDVTNLYTIVPLRAASARILIEQSIGRGATLALWTAHGRDGRWIDSTSSRTDKFQEIIDEANRPDGFILKERILEKDEFKERSHTVVAKPSIDLLLGLEPEPPHIAESKTEKGEHDENRVAPSLDEVNAHDA